MAMVPNAVEIVRKFTTVWVGCTSVTDSALEVLRLCAI